MSHPRIDVCHPTGVHGRIPAFTSIEPDAAFWDTLDVTDDFDESPPNEITVGSRLAARLTPRSASRPLLEFD